MKNRRVLFLGIDGADPMLMSRFLNEGALPNIQKFIDQGTANKDYGMLGVQPTITPPNWASLATGAYPGTHGITCYWNHESGNPLTQLDVGFNSKLCRAEFIWDSAIKAGGNAIVFNYPTSWPPTNEKIIAVDGTAINPNSHGYCESEGIYFGDINNADVESELHEKNNSGLGCVVEDDIETLDFEFRDYEENQTESFVIADDKRTNATNIKFKIDRYNCPIKDKDGELTTVLLLNQGRTRRYGRLVKNADGKYDTMEILKKRSDETPIGTVKVGEYSDWIEDEFTFTNITSKVYYKVKLIDLAEDASSYTLYRSYILDASNKKYFYPQTIADELLENVGPMLHMSACGFDDVMLETMAAEYEWIENSMIYLGKNKPWDVFYMHCHALDCCNHNYQNLCLPEYTGEKADYYMNIVREYYKITDHLVKRMMETFDDGNTVIVLASDHGGMSKAEDCETPLVGDPWSVGGKVMEDLGYLSVDRSSGVPVIDWSKTVALGQRSGYIYINLKGRDPEGIVELKDYDSLVKKIKNDLLDYKDEQGRRPVAFAFDRDEMEVLGLYGSTVGDIYFVFNPEWTRVHGTSLTTHSYKGTSVKAFFAMMGAGVKAHNLIERRVRAVDVVPTVCALTGIPVPKDCEGAVIYQALEQ
ncbi:MAG: alkaline phosphatase family protein [Peptococcaceae bacterium]|nr:alkaline phosphatase family protein [Peptococcaceae bacterium]